MHTTQIGNRGEQLAAEVLARSRYEILDLNWKTKWAEIDIVVRKNNVIYFVEVKTRKNSAQGDGFDYITTKKLQHMVRAAELWVAVHKWEGEYELLAAAVDTTNLQVRLRPII